MSDNDANGFSVYGYMDGKQGAFVLNVLGFALAAMFFSPLVVSLFVVK